MWTVQAQEVSLGPNIPFEANALYDSVGDTDKLQVEVQPVAPMRELHQEGRCLLVLVCGAGHPQEEPKSRSFQP